MKMLTVFRLIAFFEGLSYILLLFVGGKTHYALYRPGVVIAALGHTLYIERALPHPHAIKSSCR